MFTVKMVPQHKPQAKHYVKNSDRIKKAVRRYEAAVKNRDPIGLRAKQRIAERKADEAQRVRALMLLGGMCERCKNNDMRVLQIDHVNGGGYAARKGPTKSPQSAVRDVFKNPLKYQLLCANDNWIKRWERGENKPRLAA